MAKALLVLLCLLAGGASAAPVGPAVVSCKDAGKGTCVEWRNLDATGTQAMKDLCATSKGTAVWSEGQPCATSGRIAHCSMKGLKSVTVRNYYLPFTVEKAKQDCGLNPLGEFQSN